MSFTESFDAIKEKATDAAQSAVRKTKQLAEIAKTNVSIHIEEDKIKKAQGKTQAIIRSMTPRERRNPKLLNASRRKRIAAGSGTTVQDVNQLIRQFEESKKQMKMMMNQMKKNAMHLFLKLRKFSNSICLIFIVDFHLLLFLGRSECYLSLVIRQG